MRPGILAVIMLITGLAVGVGAGYFLFSTVTTTIYKTKTATKVITKTEFASLTTLAREIDPLASKSTATTLTKTVIPTPLRLPAKGEWIIFEKAGRLYTISSDGTGLRSLGDMEFVGRSPSGDKIAILGREDGEWALMILNPDTFFKIFDKFRCYYNQHC